MDSFEDLDAQLEQLQAQLKNDIQKVWFTLFHKELRENLYLKFSKVAKSYHLTWFMVHEHPWFILLHKAWSALVVRFEV